MQSTQWTSKYKVIVLDFDKTILSLNVDWSQLKKEFKALAIELGVEWIDDLGINRNLNRLKVDEKVYSKFIKLNEKYEVLGFNKESINHQLLSLASAFDNVAIFTANTHTAVEKMIHDNQLFEQAVYIIGKEDVSDGKPNPEGLKIIAENFNVVPEDIIYIGDSKDDEESAISFGCDFKNVEAINE